MLAWLQRLPGMADTLQGAKLEGAADASVQWKGGWGKLQQRLQHTAATPVAGPATAGQPAQRGPAMDTGRPGCHHHPH
jgi:hypothetical protein